nr:reverse transcriptase domain-containing protein [Tanacetum cinerariifolium]
RSNRRRVPNIVEPEIRTIEEVVLMADRTMEELLQAPTEGYGEAIVIPEIHAENFEIKTNLLQQVITPASAKAVEKTCVICGASTSGTLLSNTVPNPKGEMKAVTTRSSLAYEGPSIPTDSPLEKVVEQNTEETTEKEHSNYLRSTTHIQPLVIPISIPEPDVPRTQPRPTIPYPFRLNDQKLRMDVCHALADLGASINLTPLSIWKKLSLLELTPTRMTLELADSNPTLVFDPLISESGSCKEPIVKSSSPTLTPFRESDFFLEEIKDFLNDDLIPMGINNSFYDPGISKSLLIPKTRKKQLSHALMELLLTLACLLACVMLQRGIVLGQKILKSGIEVDRVKVDIIAKLPHSTTVKGVRSFLGHAECVDAFDTLKKKLTEAPILVVPDWNLPFELMCDASDFAIGVVLGQRKMKHFQPIHYASKTMIEAQIHYTMTEKEMLVVVYAFEKFRPYLVLSKSIVYTDHSALKYLLNKQDAKPRLENPHKDVSENKDINDNFPLETLGSLSCNNTPWFADIANFHAGNFIKKY